MASKDNAYQCPNCTGPLEFSAETGMFHCGHCGSAFTEEFVCADGAPQAGCLWQTGQQPDWQSEGQQTDYDGRIDGRTEKKKGGLLRVAAGILAVFSVLSFLAGAGDFLGSLFAGDRGSAEEIKTLKTGLPVINTHIPDAGGYVTSFGGLSFAVPRGYVARHSGGQYTVENPDDSGKIDRMTAIYDGTYTPDLQNAVLAQHKAEFGKVTTVAVKKMEGYLLYYITGKKKVGKKSCTAVCFLILRENEMYVVTMESNLRESKLGMAAEYLAFDPSAVFEP